jgi:pyruvate/2-oxoacid:ferredoxin oxidoreductase beta subunit
VIRTKVYRVASFDGAPDGFASAPLDALREAEAYEGPSIVLAYAHCIAHGIDMRMGLDQQNRAVHSGYVRATCRPW